MQVYVQGFPKSGAKFMVSATGGARPRWRRDGGGGEEHGGKPHELFQTRAIVAPIGAHIYDVSADGQRFLIKRDEGPVVD